jgi:hypothetical protein
VFALLLATVLPLSARTGVAGAAADSSDATGRWYRMEFQGVPAGWTHEIETGEGSVRGEMSLRFSRMGALVTLWQRYEFSPPSAGLPASAVFELGTGPEDTLRYSCRFDADSVRVEKVLHGERSRYARPVDRGFLRPDQVALLWRDRADGNGRLISYDSFSPETDGILSFETRMEGIDTLATGEGRRPLRRWRTSCKTAPAFTTIEWRDEEGELWRSESPALGIAGVRVAREEALAAAAGAEVLARMMIPLNEPLDSRLPYRRVLYLVTSPRGSRALIPPADPFVNLRSAGDSLSVIECRRLDPPRTSVPLPDLPAISPLSPQERARALRPT